MGHKHSAKTKAKIARAMIGNQNTKGLKWSAEARANMSKAVKGKPRTRAQRAATLRSLELARLKNPCNKPGMNWRIFRAGVTALIAVMFLCPAAAQPVPNLIPGNANPVWLTPDPRGAVVTHIAANGSTLIKAGGGWISTISINTAAVGTMTIYDGTDATGMVMAVIDVSKSTVNVAVVTPWPFKVGCFVVVSATGSDITIITH